MNLDSIVFVLGVCLVAVGLGLWHLPLALIWLGFACMGYAVLVELAKVRATARVQPAGPKRPAKSPDKTAK